MDDLIAFLRARLDEDAAAARAADPGLNYMLGAIEHAYDKVEADQQHALRHSPTRVLAEVDAKRCILTGIEDADPYGAHITGIFTAWDVLRLLALPYADHPDYKDTWRP